jgi:serine/threonine protein kinase
MDRQALDMPSVCAQGSASAPPSDLIPLATGDPVETAGYSLIGRLGSGGMGIVYLGRAEDGGLAAVKIAHDRLSGDEEVHARFRAEAACLARVPAHCTARLLLDGTEETPPYIITEYIPGRSLREAVEKDGPLPAEQLEALAKGVARKLAAIHDAGLLHRDLKPANVLLAPTGPRIIDFGIAQPVAASGGPTGIGMVVGTVGWIAPERLSHRPATQASDMFTWGCLVTYAGTGRNPFGVGEPHEMARRAIVEPPDLDGLPPSLRPLVEATLAKTPADRPTAEQVLDRLDADARLATGPLRPPVRPVRRKHTALAAGSAVLAVAASVAAWTIVDGGGTPPADARPPVRHTGSASANLAAISRDAFTSPPHTHKPAGQHPRAGHHDQPGHAKKIQVKKAPPKKPKPGKPSEGHGKESAGAH